jgi:hypothetical protein
LIIENHTQTIPGFLFNKGRGRTEFRRGAMAINDSLYVIGGDTINLYKGRVNVTASNGVYATGNNIKLGGEINEITQLSFPDPEEGGRVGGQLSLWSSDFNSAFKIQDIYDSRFGSNMQVLFNTSNDGSETNLQITPYRFYSSVGPRSILLDSTGFHVMKSSLYLGFNTALPPMGERALLYLSEGNSSPGGAPLKFTPGTLLTTVENGSVEYDNYDLYFTAQSARYKLAKVLDGQLTTNFGGAALSAFNSVTTSLTITGAQAGDVVNVSANSGAVNPPSIIITAYVTSDNTVTLQAYNASNSAVTIASDTYKVRVIK